MSRRKGNSVEPGLPKMRFIPKSRKTWYVTSLTVCNEQLPSAGFRWRAERRYTIPQAFAWPKFEPQSLARFRLSRIRDCCFRFFCIAGSSTHGIIRADSPREFFKDGLGLSESWRHSHG